MPQLFTCPHCQTRTLVEDRYSGRSGRCVTCNEPITIPPLTRAASTRSRSRPLAWIFGSILAILVGGTLIVLLVQQGGQTINRLQTNRERFSSMRNLERIASALHAYSLDHGHYPPPVTRDASGQPLHSWRVLLLPYLGEEALYDEFRLDLPWSDPVNQSIAQVQIPDVYRHPTIGGGPTQLSAYYLVVGPGTLFPPDGPLAPGEISDQASQTLLVTEGLPRVSSGVWIEPVDLEFTLMRGDLTTGGGQEPGGWSDSGVAMVTADGRAHFLPLTTPPLVVRSLVTPRGNEQLPDDTLD